MKITAAMRNKPLLLVLAGVLTVIIAVCGVFVYQHLFRVGYKSTGEHDIVNKLSDSLNFLPYFKGGNIYYYRNGESVLAAENAYDTNSETPAYTADYAIDAKSGRMLYTSGGALYLFNGEQSDLIAQNVIAWRTCEGLSATAFLTKWNNSEENGMLFLYSSGETTAIDTDVVVSTVRFSRDGTRLFYQKPNYYPEIRSTLFCADLSGNKRILDRAAFPIMWTSGDGTSAVTGDNDDDSLYTYRVFAKDFDKKREFFDVYFAEVSDDGSILYLLHDYDTELKIGKLTAVDTYTLKTKEITDNASFFNLSAVTDSSKGVVYSVLTDREMDTYSIFYGSISGKNIRLIRNTTEESLYSVALNTEKNSGYILVYGASRMDGGVFSLKWSGNDVESRRLFSGYLDGLVYYEATHSVTFVSSPAEATAPLYRATKDGAVMIADNCGVNYSSGSQTYTSASVLSNDGSEVLYFTDIVTGDNTLDTKGTMWLSGNEICKSVSSAYMEAPVVNGDLSEIYYTVETENGLDLYLYKNGESKLIEPTVHGIVQLNK